MLPTVLLCLAAASGCSKPAAEQAAAKSIPMATPALAGSALPHLSHSTDDVTVLSWVEPDGDAMALRYATLEEISSKYHWGAPNTVATGTDWFVNWADYPSVEHIKNDRWAAHWLKKTPGGTYAYDVQIAVSEDAGATWPARITPHTDGTATEHGFVTLYPWYGDVAAIWLDGRNTQPVNDAGHMSHGAGGMTLRSATLSATQDLTLEHLVDDLICDCCQTDVALTARGPIAVYRNRTEDEVRDIAIARQDASQGGWRVLGIVAEDNWQIAGCPVNGPVVSADQSYVAVAWFTGVDERPRVRVALSSDDGDSFPVVVDIPDDATMGRVDVVSLGARGAVVSWLSRRQRDESALMAQYISGSGLQSPAVHVATTGATRAGGFPQMTLDKSGTVLLFAWTDAREQPTQIFAAQMLIFSLLDIG